MAIKLGVSPIAWSNDDLVELGGDTTLEMCLNDIREIGFDGVELGNKFPKDKVELKKILDSYSLSLVGGWFSGFLLKNGVEKEKKRLEIEMEKRRFCNCNNIVYAECSNTIQSTDKGISKKPFLTIKELISYSKKYEELSIFAKKEGFIMSYHHHMGTILQNSDEVDIFLENTSPDVGLTYDTGHYYFSNADPIYELKKHFKRIFHIHLKDVRKDVRDFIVANDKSFLEAVKMGVYTVPGDGCINFKEIIKFICAKKYDGWLVIEAEQDPKKADPFIYSQNSFNFINSYLKENQ